MRKRKLEAVKDQKVEYGAIFVKYSLKSNCLVDHHLQRNVFKDLWFT